MVENKRVLLLAPPYMDIYKDIVKCLEEKRYDVVWVEDSQIKYNPYNLNDVGIRTKTKEEYDEEVKYFWKCKLQEPSLKSAFDYFLAIDGMMASPYLFDNLREKNKDIRCVLFLYDRIEGNYELDVFFKYYTEIFSFDIGDCRKYNLRHLPIYWVPADGKTKDKYDIFGLASFNWGPRYEIFKKIKKICRERGLRDYIKLWHSPVGNTIVYQLRYIVKKSKGQRVLPLRELRNEIFTSESLSPSDFRKIIQESRVILDTQSSLQDGLTARCMWSLGAGKKIITTNKAIKEYPFYSEDGIFILEDNYEDIIDFVERPYTMPQRVKNILIQYRIDNWIDKLLGI